MPNQAHAFLTEKELREKPWVRLIADPTLLCRLIVVDHDNLQRLKPRIELNGDIINSYINLCQARNKDSSVKLLPTYFWPQVSTDGNYDGATRMLHSVLVSIVFSADSDLFFRSNQVIKCGKRVRHGRYDEASASTNVSLEDVKHLYIPVHQNRNHWLLLRMNVRDRCWEFYDSLCAISNETSRTKVIDVRHLTTLFVCEIMMDFNQGGDQLSHHYREV